MRKLAFSEPEYHRRLRRAQELMRERGLDVLVLSDLSNICYLTGFQTIGSYGYADYALIITPEGEPVLYSSDFESHNATISSWVDDVVTYAVEDQITGCPISRLAGLLQERGLGRGRIGCERGHYGMTVNQFEMFVSALPDAEVIDAGGILEPAKIVKSPEEIATVQRAAGLTTGGILAGIAAACEGSSDNDIAAAIYESVIKAGGEYFSLQPIVTSGRRSGIPHSTFHRTRLARGDCILVEVAASWERYSAPTLRTICIGPPSDEVRRAFDGALASVSVLLEDIRPGASGRDIAVRAGKALRAVEPNLVWHGCYAYSVGLAFPPACCDCPLTGVVSEHTDLELRAGMVFHCSTSLRKVGEFAVTVGDTVAVTETGCERLTGVPMELTVV